MTTYDLASQADLNSALGRITTVESKVLSLDTRVSALELLSKPPTPIPTAPLTVTDLAVSSPTTSSLLVTFTEVSGGTGSPANYELRYSTGNLVWGTAISWPVLVGTSVGAKRAVVVTGLLPGTSYQFQLVAFRGTLNVDAVFGNFSNVANGITTSVVVPPPPPSPVGTLPRVLNDQSWLQLTGNGWSYLKRTNPRDAVIALDATAPKSPSSVLRIFFTPGMQPDTEPTVHWMALHGETEIETEWWGKLSPNWTASPAGAGKITFLMGNGGQVYTNYYHQGGNEVTGWVPGPPYRFGINTEWAPYGQKLWLPNKTVTLIPLDKWVRFRAYYKWASAAGAADGILRFWVDDVLNGDYANVQYPANRGFIEFQYAPTRQNVPPTEQWMDIDHTIVRVP